MRTTTAAALYGVETRIINQAVKNNPGKFPAGYVVELTQEEIKVLRSKILTLETNPGWPDAVKVWIWYNFAIRKL